MTPEAQRESSCSSEKFQKPDAPTGSRVLLKQSHVAEVLLFTLVGFI